MTYLYKSLELPVNKGIDIIGDIHACYDEMILLLEKLGYKRNADDYFHPEGRRLLSLGDIMSRGPKSLVTMQFFLRHINKGLAYMIDSNHGWKIARWLDGRNVKLGHGDELVAEEFKLYEQKFGQKSALQLKEELKKMLLRTPSHYILTNNNEPVAVCAHAGIKDEFIGKQSKRISDFCRYGDTDGFDETGRPIRKDWFLNHQSSIPIIWGHDPRPTPLKINNTINIDQGVVFGGELTAYRYPEKELVSVKARKNYANTDDNPLTRYTQKHE